MSKKIEGAFTAEPALKTRIIPKPTLTPPGGGVQFRPAKTIIGTVSWKKGLNVDTPVNVKIESAAFNKFPQADPFTKAEVEVREPVRKKGNLLIQDFKITNVRENRDFVVKATDGEFRAQSKPLRLQNGLGEQVHLVFG